ncbi:MAG: terminase large subunit, partial [Rhodopirellula sp.]|nr:terminase large subunit [Rhodopirellula sp.]
MTKTKEKNYVAIAARYAEDVVSAKIPTCRWTIKACQRQIDDLEKAKSKEYSYKFDKDKGSRVCRFIEMLPHIKGEWAKTGARIELQPWQIFILTAVFGWVQRDTGLRRFKTAYFELPRKNGKSSLSSGVGIYCCCADGEAGSETYSAATTRDQAKIVWQDAWHMVQKSPGLKKAFGVSTTAHAISQISTASRFQALSAEGNSLDGLNIHCAIVDELHAHRTRKVFDVLETATGARTQPLLWLITTAGSDRSGICYEQRTYLTKILDGAAKDDTYFGVIYTIDDEDDWRDPAIWAKANPNYGVSVLPDDLERLCLKAQEMPSAQNNFLTKRLSVWVNADAPLFDAAKWEKCGDETLRLEQYHGEPCWVGLDLAPRHDFCAMVLLFRTGGKYIVFARHYLSEMEVDECGNSSYPGWARDGWIITNPGNSTDYDQIEEELLSIQAKFDLQGVCYDPAGAKQILDHMQAHGLPMIEMRPIVINFSEPTKLLDALIADGKIRHNCDPVLAWELSNVVGHYDRKDNVYPVKERPENKIDGP